MNMRKNILVSIGVCGLVVMAVACGGNKKAEETKDGKLTYTPQINEVTVVKLEKTDFARQLLSNGKLVASRKSALQFRTTGKIAAINVRNGEYVSSGAVIATVDRPDLKLSQESSRLSLRKAELDLYDYLVGQGYSAGDTTSVPADPLAMAKMNPAIPPPRTISRARPTRSPERFSMPRSPGVSLTSSRSRSTRVRPVLSARSWTTVCWRWISR